MSPYPDYLYIHTVKLFCKAVVLNKYQDKECFVISEFLKARESYVCETTEMIIWVETRVVNINEVTLIMVAMNIHECINYVNWLRQESLIIPTQLQ